MVHKIGKPVEEYSRIELVITKTSKTNPKEPFTIFDEEKKSFNTIEEANAWLKEQYGKHKKSPMYLDSKEGTAKKVGFIVGFKEKEFDRDSGKYVNYIEQDWVEFRKTTPFELGK